MKKVLIVALCLLILLSSLLSNATIKTTKAQEEPQPYEETNNIFDWQQLKNIIEHEHEFIIKLNYENFYYDEFLSSTTETLFQIEDLIITMTCYYRQDGENLYLNIKEIELEASIAYDEQYTLISNELSNLNTNILNFNINSFIEYESNINIYNFITFENRYNSFIINSTIGKFGTNDTQSISGIMQTPYSLNIIIDNLDINISKEFPHEQYRQNYLSIANHVRNEIDMSENYNNLLSNTFNSFAEIANIQIFPGITLGLIIGLPLLLGLFLIILKLIRG